MRPPRQASKPAVALRRRTRKGSKRQIRTNSGIAAAVAASTIGPSAGKIVNRKLIVSVSMTIRSTQQHEPGEIERAPGQHECRLLLDGIFGNGHDAERDQMKAGDEGDPQCVAVGGSMSGPAAGQRCKGGRHGKLPVPGNEPLHTPSTRTTVIELYYLCHGKIIPMYRPVIVGNIGQFPLDRERSNERAF